MLIDCYRPHADQTIVCAGRVYQRGGLSSIERENRKAGGLHLGSQRRGSGST